MKILDEFLSDSLPSLACYASPAPAQYQRDFIEGNLDAQKFSDINGY